VFSLVALLFYLPILMKFEKITRVTRASKIEQKQTGVFINK
jgi:hypothetical protein